MIPAIPDSDTSDREIVLSRVFDAPRALVWQAWTSAEHAANWWGPQGFTLTTHQHDFRPGGVWQYVMHGPDGHDYENKIVILEIVEPERLSYKHAGGGDTEHINFHVTVTFEEEGAKTKLTMRSLFPSKESRDFVIETYNAVEGGKQHLANLAEYLVTMASTPDTLDKPFQFTRVLNAPRELVWKAWTEREHLQHWFGPKGVTTPTCSLDLRVDGKFLYCMRSPEGGDMWGRWVFRVISPQERLEMMMSFSDANGGITRHPLDEDWPRELLSIVTFADHAGISKGTVVTVEWTAYNSTDVERKKFAESHDSMNQGWSGTFERLIEYLAQL